MPQFTTISESTFKSQNQPCSSTRWSSKRQRLMRETALNTKTIKLLTEEPTVHLPTTTPCYLLIPLINVGPVAKMLGISVANLMSEATAPRMGKSVANVRVLIILKPFVIQWLQQPRQHPAFMGRSHNIRPGGCLQAATMANEEANSSSRRRRQRSIHQSRKHMRLHSSNQRQFYQERHMLGKMVMYQTQSFQERYWKWKLCTTGFLALQSIVKWLIAPTLRVSIHKGCTWTLIQRIGLR